MLYFYYRDFQALKNMNISIAEKRITALIWPSGCAKSSGRGCSAHRANH